MSLQRSARGGIYQLALGFLRILDMYIGQRICEVRRYRRGGFGRCTGVKID